MNKKIIKLPNYLYKYILNCILVYIYNKLSVSYYNSVFNNNNEVIQFSLVCKQWFKYVSNILSLQINYKNYFALYPLIENPTHNLHNKYKIIKLSNLNILYDMILTSNHLDRYINNINNSNNNNNNNNNDNNNHHNNDYNFNNKNILVHSFDYMESNNIIKNIRRFPDCFNFNLSLSSTSQPENYIQLLNNSKDCLNKINRVSVNDHGQRDGLKNILKLNDIYNISFQDDYSSSSNILLKLKFNQTKKSKINIDHLILTYNFNKNNYMDNYQTSTRKLKKFRFDTTLNKLIFNNKTNLLGISDEEANNQNNNHNQESWENIVKVLSNDQTLQRLSINDQGNILGRSMFSNIETSLIYGGFGSILASPLSNIKSFSFFSDSVEIDPQLLKGISCNKSIQNLTIPAKYFVNIINNEVMVNNRTIRNLFITSGVTEALESEILEGLHMLSVIEQYNTMIDIYSISFDINTNNENLHSLVSFIKSNHFNIKEFNITNKYNPHLVYERISYQLHSNHSIINVSTR
ncbi:hypothetical protein DICPUDRAFT_96896 [Dictyostelium purpureum]|uniref:Uncharacterized protein n=1 Tax=Dictyostelium purpureum TaxID=5786 RepID=F0ZC42_DICPU|nr:uncharacterized protein DICPUDRAFT_96896 [Dictyostelium purpureum]EGC38509.1 hypothetical protein DICPUDRAFT_96896 [Dictyostelium purpureum]|eukprot:XP_003284974.1 hypothetical protein DICPUDRAFT_96896 [Dictyostelium purpureum]